MASYSSLEATMRNPSSVIRDFEEEGLVHTAAPTASPAIIPAMRFMLYLAGALVFITGVQLFILTEQTDRYFAWTIQPPLTAATLGAAYWASCALELAAARERIWTHARIAVPAVVVFTALTLVVTLLHIDRFHLASPELITRGAAWAWLVVYAAVPALLGGMLIVQATTRGVDPPLVAPLPGWLTAVLAVQVLIMLPLGLLMLAAPALAIEFWPWKLTPLTARAIGAWAVGLGLAVAQTLREKDLMRVRPAIASYIAFGALELVALARYSGDIDWTRPSATIYVAYMASVLLAGIGGWLAARRAGR